jgi:type II secretory pathway predicted ATPase ExeA
VVLIGQTELKARLTKRPYRALRQRIGLQYHLGPLDERETGEYVAHRLRVAGREAPLFDAAALAALHRSSEGVPRLINVLAGNALIEGFGRGAAAITEEIIEDVAKELK